ncbi:hypothetical protein MTQ01_23895 [Streptomyces sp. XM4193]|uniref:hypothetical protein n=1 Tax=Streptomyces sp. XM4193 TaxID=2929782 RepID=UPI001FF73880|nr:hypothetical protein [Streptomyces sp. XM4193]MCK1799017.1 hypothetical protein [Streptomyces sp. XM4193]
MPLHARTAPSHALRTVEAALSSSHPFGQTPPSPSEPPSEPAPGPELRVAAALPLHLLPSIGDRVPSAPLTGWRFLLAGDTGPLLTADSVPSADGWAFSHFSDGPYAASALRCLDSARTLSATYEPRLLCVPELYMVTLWLHCPGPARDQDHLGPADLLIPLAPAPPGIAAERPVRVDGLLPLLTHRLHPAAPALLRTA